MPARAAACTALLALAALAALVVLAAPAARAQLPGAHPLPRGPRPLHELAASADAIGVGTIDAASEGRIAVRDVAVVSGSLPPQIELKRSPSRPPAFAVGDRALLLLRGARSPYVMVDEPRETVVVPAGGDAAFVAALREFQSARSDPPRLRDVYVAWIDGDDEGLRELGLRGIHDPAAPFLPLPADLAVASARRALDPAVPEAVRRARASLAVLGAEGFAVLAQGVLEPGTAVDPVVYETALQGALLRREGAVDVTPALWRGVGSGDATVRQVAVRYAAHARDEALVTTVERLATEDGDPAVREAARRATAGARIR